jgi:leucyl-tRNA synthetase
MSKCFEENGKHINSEDLDGLNTNDAMEKIITQLEIKGVGKKAITYKLRD